MVEDKICIRFIDHETHETKIITKLLNNIEYVEQLVYEILDDEGVKPVCRNLFGLKSTVFDNLWLAPNESLKRLIGRKCRRGPDVKSNILEAIDGEPKLEIRMRFRPSCVVRVSLLDSTAFEIIFAQINHDFMRTRFNEEKRDFVLLNDSVLGLVALNLIRHSVEQGIGVEDILKQVKRKDFIPKRAARWQSALLFLIAKQINLQESLRIGFEQCDNDTQKIKQKFIELFLLNVATDYNCELYDVYQLIQKDENVIKSEVKQLRVRYNQSQEEATCFIEIRTKIKVKDGGSLERGRHQNDNHNYESRWAVICDIQTINHATLNEDQVQIAGSSGDPQRFQFKSSLYAKSFLSSIDGYHRLMRRWNFNLCREVSSPELKYLAELGSHGPIGLETTRAKLSDSKRKDCYLVRKCMDHPNKFLIDTIICERVLLTIDVDWYPNERVFRKTGHTISLKGKLDVSVRTGQEAYSLLKTLINDIEIRIMYDLKKDSQPLMRVRQLKYMIHPTENDFYPALMLSMSMKELRQLENNAMRPCMPDSARQQLPVVIPSSSLCSTRKLYPTAENGLSVELGCLNRNQQVVVKNYAQLPLRRLISEYTFHYCPESHADMGRGMRPSQLRLADWLFVKSNLFAETVGFVIGGALVQEYFPLGRLDLFLRDNPHEVSLSTKLSISFQLAQALLFLDEQQIIHGKIRCHNIMLKNAQPVQVKLTDPLGAVDVKQDQAFIPSEYFSSNVQVCVKKFYTGIDIWAAGTTMWQIFNHGLEPPPGRYANTLLQRNCPDKVWNLIEGCWVVEANSRTSPRILHRDLFNLIAWEEGSHNYSALRPDDLDVSIEPRDTPPPTTTNSSNSDLSTLGNLDSSILSSPNSTYSNNSRADLLKQRISCPNPVAQNQSDSRRGITTQNSSQIPFSMSNQSTSFNRRTTYSNWANLINIKRASKQSSHCDLPPERLDDLFGSRVSLGSCSTPSGSEITRSTEIMDSQSLSEAYDRCVWHVDSHRLKLGAEIGRGSSGIVIKGFMSQVTGDERVVAVKCIDRDCADPNRIEDLKREFDILKDLDHENIVKTLGYVDESQMMLIFEYMPLGSLLSCIRNLASQDDLFKLPLKKYALDIAKGMEYLESKKIVHRDLALRNILLNDRNEVKICDFGLAQSLGTSSHYKLETERALPLKWYAPETLSTWVFTHKSDVWSYGVVLWEIYSGGDSPQYSGTYSYLSETLKHERLPLPLGCPKHMYDLMLACWVYNPDDRKSFGEIRAMLGSHHDDSIGN